MRIKSRFLATHWQIILIVLGAFILRTWGLARQSLWVDELHTLIQADPKLSWGALFDSLRCCDQSPPLFFVVEKLSFSLCGQTEFVARFISVLAGTLSVWAVHLLGRELYSRRAGHIAALLMAVNYFGIYYSQEARPYAFALLFATLSFLWFTRLCKIPGRREATWYVVFTVCFLYSHYFSLFALAAQGAMGIVYLFLTTPGERNKLLRKFLITGIILAVAYLPWMPYFLNITGINSFWLDEIRPSFIQDFFFAYFGDADLLKPFLVLLVLSFFAQYLVKQERIELNGRNLAPRDTGLLLLLSWIFITLLIPYLRSLLVVPMLHPRYTIIILPAVLVILAQGICAYRSRPVIGFLIALFVLLSLLHLIYVKKHYGTVHKTQFRELAEFIKKENREDHPLVAGKTQWHQAYYRERFRLAAPLIPGNRDTILQSILKNDTMAPRGFWIIGAHNEEMPSTGILKDLDSLYILKTEKKFYDAWALQFVLRQMAEKGVVRLEYGDFSGSNAALLNEEKRFGLWEGKAHSKSVKLDKGIYKLTLSASGSVASGMFPNIIVSVNGVSRAFDLKEQLLEYSFDLEIEEEREITVGIEITNDLSIPGKGDRNVFISGVVIRKLPY